MAASKIEWTDATWNPVTGCNKISPGCKRCYAERMAKRLQATGMAKYRNGFDVTLHPDTLDIPLRWRKSRSIFVNSMSDLFHVDVPDDFVRRVFDVMERAHWHRYQVLTKRPERVADVERGHAALVARKSGSASAWSLPTTFTASTCCAKPTPQSSSCPWNPCSARCPT